jgi:aldose sugar dehydrogenase
VSGFVTPSTIAFPGPDDFLVLEKNTGRVKRVLNGVVQGVVLDLSVNNASECGLLGIAVHPNFRPTRASTLYWTCRSTGAARLRPVPTEEGACSDGPAAMFGQLDSGDLLRVPLRRNRVDRFVWTPGASSSGA